MSIEVADLKYLPESVTQQLQSYNISFNKHADSSIIYASLTHQESEHGHHQY